MIPIISALLDIRTPWLLVQPVIKRNSIMATGTVKWFNKKKGYGFITPDEGGNDVFVHISAVQKAGLRSLDEGAKISYELMTEREKTVAGDLKLL